MWLQPLTARLDDASSRLSGKLTIDVLKRRLYISGIGHLNPRLANQTHAYSLFAPQPAENLGLYAVLRHARPLEIDASKFDFGLAVLLLHLCPQTGGVACWL